MIRRLIFLSLLFATIGCEDPLDGDSQSEQDDRFGAAGDSVQVVEPIDYTDEPYTFKGPTGIADIYPLFPESEFVWYGMEEGVNRTGPCDFRGNEIAELPDLPLEIEGIATIQPRYFQKIQFCGNDERYYGAYIIEDETGGIIVMKDSRVSDFTYGDKVKLRVRGLLKFFDTRAILVSDEEEVIERGLPVYYNDIGSRDLTVDDVGFNVRIRGEVASEPTNSNFNELCLVPEGESYEACSPDCVGSDACGGYILVSIDREIGQRNPIPLTLGKVVEITGPVVNNFGLKLLVLRVGQLNILKQAE